MAPYMRHTLATMSTKTMRQAMTTRMKACLHLTKTCMIQRDNRIIETMLVKATAMTPVWRVPQHHTFEELAMAKSGRRRIPVCLS